MNNDPKLDRSKNMGDGHAPVNGLAEDSAFRECSKKEHQYDGYKLILCVLILAQMCATFGYLKEITDTLGGTVCFALLWLALFVAVFVLISKEEAAKNRK